jgi:hypothetical protein
LSHEVFAVWQSLFGANRESEKFILKELKNDTQSLHQSESSPLGVAGALLPAMRLGGQRTHSGAEMQRNQPCQKPAQPASILC